MSAATSLPKQLELARAEALRRIQQQQQPERKKSEVTSLLTPLSQTATLPSSRSSSVRAPHFRPVLKKRNTMNLKYCEYDLSNMHDTRGGFILETPAGSSNEELVAGSSADMPASIIPTGSICEQCKSIDVCVDYFAHYKVEQFAIKKWGSLVNLDSEFARRGETKQMRKKRKYESKLKELRQSTLTSAYLKLQEQNATEHQHQFGKKTSVGGDKEYQQRCLTCGLVFRFEDV
ncbi:hypothetical protein HDU82_002536 [Entophlyctis luteolus]|nr:hypothetical protein HDU82_002536 [Entophlyctis luteolus]